MPRRNANCPNDDQVGEKLPSHSEGSAGPRSSTAVLSLGAANQAPHVIRSVLFFLLVCLAPFLFGACGLTGYGANDASLRMPVYHVVHSGETIKGIAGYYGVSASTLVRLNGIRSSDRLSPGQRLLVGYRYEGEDSKAVRKVAHRDSTTSRSPGPAFIAQGRLGWPVNTGHIASTFGPRWGSFHDGLDFAAGAGSPVFAAHNGRVVYADNEISGYGNLIIVRGDDNLLTVYAHNERLLVSNGERVDRGEQIAKVGSTGHAQGPHLHFEVRARDSKGRYVAVDPWPLLVEKDLKTKPRYRVNENLFSVMAKIFK